MNGQWWSVIGVVVSCLGGYLTARLSVKATNRKTDAEARAVEVATQQRLIKGWDTELGRRDKQIAKQEKQIDDFSKRLEAIDSDLQDAHEQNDLLAAELAEERKKVSLITAALETAQAHLKAALAELDTVKEQLRVSVSQNAIFREHFTRMDGWLVRHFNENGHTNETDKPPTLTPFDVSEEDI